jgi:hypothetical protein
MLFRYKLLSLVRFPVLQLWFFEFFLTGFVISYAILCPVIFLHNSFFFDKILIYFCILFFCIKLLFIKFSPILNIWFYLGLLCYCSIYSNIFCFDTDHLYSSVAWLQSTKLSCVDAINMIGISIFCIFFNSYSYFISNWWSFIIILRMYYITCYMINYGILVFDLPN